MEKKKFLIPNSISCAAICPLANIEKAEIEETESGPILAASIEIQGKKVDFDLHEEIMNPTTSIFDSSCAFSVASLLDTEVPQGAIARCELPETLVAQSQVKKGARTFVIFKCPFHPGRIHGSASS